MSVENENPKATSVSVFDESGKELRKSSNAIVVMFNEDEMSLDFINSTQPDVYHVYIYMEELLERMAKEKETNDNRKEEADEAKDI